MLPALKNLLCPECLKACNLSRLHNRCICGDMIEKYKIITGKYDPLVWLQKNWSKYDLWQCFTNRVVNMWNSGTVCQIMLSLPACLKIDWITSGKAKILCMIFKHKFMEPDVAVRCSLKFYRIYLMMKIVLNWQA